jgi:hypothetical protein
VEVLAIFVARKPIGVSTRLPGTAERRGEISLLDNVAASSLPRGALPRATRRRRRGDARLRRAKCANGLTAQTTAFGLLPRSSLGGLSCLSETSETSCPAVFMSGAGAVMSGAAVFMSGTRETYGTAFGTWRFGGFCKLRNCLRFCVQRAFCVQFCAARGEFALRLAVFCVQFASNLRPCLRPTPFVLRPA